MTTLKRSVSINDTVGGPEDDPDTEPLKIRILLDTRIRIIYELLQGGGGLVTSLKRSVSMNDLNESDEDSAQVQGDQSYMTLQFQQRQQKVRDDQVLAQALKFPKFSVIGTFLEIREICFKNPQFFNSNFLRIGRTATTEGPR